MNLLDENIDADQRKILHNRRLPMRQVGIDFARKGLSDADIIRLLHSQPRCTFFTRDRDFYFQRLCHANYCVVNLAIDADDASEFVRRVLRHPELDSIAQRAGKILRITASGLKYFQTKWRGERSLSWND